ncbi:MAG: dNTP triphosphohydrolase [Tissierellaceae bacterium]
MELLVIKVSKNATTLLNNLQNSYGNESGYYYNTSDKTEEFCKELFESKSTEGKFMKRGLINTLIIIHEENKPIGSYLCKSEYLKYNSNIHCKKLIRPDNMDYIDNFIIEINLDLEKDFNSGVYITKKDVSEKDLLDLFSKAYPVYTPKSTSIEDQKLKLIKKDNPSHVNPSLSKFAQKDDYCIRSLGIQDIDPRRSEFQRDRERIIHTKAFRRLVDKTQIFTSKKGDHYRTRMTHTLEVSQIARGISRELDLNLDLTEAIALGHDIGHTPFGHQGERTLRDILNGKIDIIPNARELKVGGFNHNYQALRVLTYLEEKYIEHEGLDLSYQTLEGILKHTKCKFEDLNDFLIHGNTEYLYLDVLDNGDKKDSFSVTLEGQVVEIADEIAQRGHDLDDAFAAGLLSVESLIDACSVDFMSNIKDLIDTINKKISNEKQKNRIIIDEIDMIRAMLVPKILGYLMADVVETSINNIEEKDIEFFKTNNRVNRKLISFSKSGFLIAKHLENLISKNVINSFGVNRFDDKADMIITSLFRSYFTNPKLLPDSVLTRFKKELNKQSVDPIDIRFDNPRAIAEELREITTITEKQDRNEELAIKYCKKRKILVRCITDHISGMTDNYALSEYSKLHESLAGHI